MDNGFFTTVNKSLAKFTAKNFDDRDLFFRDNSKQQEHLGSSMKKMTLILIAAVFLLWVFFSNPAKAQSGSYYFHSSTSYVPYGYGYFSYSYWPQTYWIYPARYGFSYLSYYNYQPRYATYGALAYSVEDGVGGYAWGYSSRTAASQAAMDFCEGTQCEPVAWVQGGCLAMAISDEIENLTWSYGANQLQAESTALQSCHQSGASDCANKGYVCSF